MTVVSDVNEVNKETMRRYWQDTWSAQNRPLFDELMEEGFAADEQAFADILWGAFPDMRFTIEEMVAEGDAVVSRLTWSGTHQGEYGGIAPTGTRVTITGLSLYHLSNGTLIRNGQVSEFDWLGFYRQLGSIPAQQGPEQG
jgi:predicted ester cyclase